MIKEVTKTINKKKKQRSILLQKEKVTNVIFNIESFEVKECTYLLFGDEPLMQPIYNCSTCDPNRTDKICLECYDRCHKNCKKDPKFKSLLGIDSFVCECGKVNRHFVAETIDKVNITKCKFRSLDRKIKNNCMYKCEEEDNVQLCSVCFHECHASCDDSKKTKIVINETSGDYECGCSHENHTAMNEFTFNIKPEEYSNECGLPFIWPVQMLNILFDSEKIYDNLSEYIQKNLVDLSIEVRFANIVSLLSGIFSANFKTYYYHPQILNMFPYEKFIVFMFKFKEKTDEEMLLKMRMIFILLFVHVKKDFHLIKSFSISDFMTSNILERLLFREFINTNNLYTKDIHDKYHINLEDKYIEASKEEEFDNMTAKDISLKQIATKVGFLLAKGIKQLDLVSFQKEFKICLKFISFMLKRMVFTTKELDKLIKSLFNFNNQFISMLVEDGKDELNSKVDLLIPTFSYLAKIFYLIGINYNDVIVSKNLKIEGKKTKNSNFIQTNGESSGKLFKMIVKNCSIITDYYKKIDSIRQENENNDKNANQKMSVKVVKIFNEALKLFCLADNNYYYQLQKITAADLKIFYSRRKALLRQQTKSKKKEINKNASLANADMQEDKDILLEFKQKIEETLDEFFTYKNITDTNERLIANIKEFSAKSMNNIYGISKSFRMDSHDGILEESIKMKKLPKDEKRKIDDYITKLISVIRENFAFVTKSTFKEKIDLFIDELIYSAIDETLSKFLYFFCQQATGVENILPDFEVDIVLSFLSFFCLNKAGIKYFCSGKNLTRIMNIFYNYPKRVLQFFYQIFKGLALYKVEISNHKILPTLMTQLLEHLRNFKFDSKNEKEFNLQLILVMKIFIIAGNNYEYEEYESIKKQVIDIMRTRNLLSKDKFKKIFELDFEKEKKYFEEQQKVREDLINEQRVRTPDVNVFVHGSGSSTAKYSNEAEEDKFTDKDEKDEKADLLIVRENTTTKPTKIRQKSESKASLLQGEQELISIDIIGGGSNSYHSENNDGEKNKAGNNNYNLNQKSRKILHYDKNGEDIPESVILNKLYFTFFNLINKNTYYFFDDPEEIRSLQDIFAFNDLYYYRIILSKYKLVSVRNRSILLQFLRTYYFIDVLCHSDIKKRQGYLSTKEYKQYFTNTLKSDQKINLDRGQMEKYPKENEYESGEQQADVKKKYEFILHIKSVIEIFIQEINSFEILIMDEKHLEHIETYIKELVLSVKFISDFIVNEDVWNKITVTYYKLAKEFMLKTEIFKSVLVNIKNDNSVGKLPKINKTEVSRVMIMEKSDFDIFNKQKIYDLLLETFTEIKTTIEIDKEFTLKTYLDTFDNTAELNFTSSALIETKDYEYFYEKEEKEKLTDEFEIKLKKLIDSFSQQFIDINNTTFMNTIQSISGEAELIDYRINIVQYFVSYINSDTKNHTHNYTYSLLCIITKMMFYDTNETQNKLAFLMEENYDDFFQKFNSKLQFIFVLNFATAKNFYNSSHYVGITNVSKLIIQFLQLLAEGFNVTFHDRVFKSFSNDQSFTFFDNIVTNLITVYNCIKVDHFAMGELSYDKLIVLVTNIIDFMVEYAQQDVKEEELTSEESPDTTPTVTADTSRPKVQKYIERLFKAKLHQILFLNLDTISSEKFTNRKKILSYLKIKFISLVIAFTQNKVGNIKFILREYSPTSLFEEIIINLDDLMTVMKMKKKVDGNLYANSPDRFLDILTDLYVYDEEFRDSLQLTLCFKIYQLILIFSDVYGLKSIKTHFEDLEMQMEADGGKPSKKEENSKNKKEDLSFNSKLAYKVYLFLERVVVKVVVRNSSDKDCATFFVRPSLTFHLTAQTMASFLNNVNRESTFSKLNSLIEESDYFLFEMLCNSHYKQNDIMNKLLQNLEFSNIEVLNYFFILLHQCLLLYHFYHSPSIKDESYDTVDPGLKSKVNMDNLIVGIIQISFLGVTLILWYIYKFPLYFQHNIMTKFRRNFLFKSQAKTKDLNSNKSVQKYFVDQDITPLKIVSDVNKDLSAFLKFKIALVDTIASNREINTLFFTFILTILYLIIGSPMILVIPTLLAANLSPILYDIFVAIRMRWKQLLTVLVFTYLIIYLFMWIALLWVNDIYHFDSRDPSGGENVNESLCSSSIQCLFFMIDYGIRSGGGIGDVLPMISYQREPTYFYGKFFYVVIFHILIILVLGNVFLGIIVDTFADLRDKNQSKEDDKRFKCFICQISRDESLNKKIEFDAHCKVDHNVWNYVYFLTFLHISNPNDFNALQNEVWDCLSQKDISWIPLLSSE